MNKHHLIRVKPCDNIKLFCSNICFFHIFCFKCCWKKGEKFRKLYESGEERLELQLDLVKMMHNMKKLKILLKNSLMSPEIEYQMLHSKKYLIDLDNTDSESDLNNDDSKTEDDTDDKDYQNFAGQR